jgi:hypothetical protein
MDSFGHNLYPQGDSVTNNKTGMGARRKKETRKGEDKDGGEEEGDKQ